MKMIGFINWIEKDNEISLPQDCQIYQTDPEWLGQVLSSPSHQWEWIHPQLTSKMSSCGCAEQSKKPPKEGGSVVIWICGLSTDNCGRRGRLRFAQQSTFTSISSDVRPRTITSVETQHAKQQDVVYLIKLYALLTCLSLTDCCYNIFSIEFLISSIIFL